MVAKKILTGLICGIMLLSGSGIGNIVSNAEEVEKTDVLIKQKTSYGADGSKILSWQYEYDVNGNLKKEKFESSNTEAFPDYIIAYEYDNANNNTKYFRYNGDGVLESYYVYTYNSENKNTKWTCYDKDGISETSREYEYDAEGHLAKETFFRNDSVVDYIIYEYDNNNLAKETEYSSDNKLMYYFEYEYDSDGNMTKK